MSSGRTFGFDEVDRERTAGRRVNQQEDEDGDDEQQRHGLQSTRRARNRITPLAYLISHSWTFQKMPVFVGLPLKCCSDAGTASSLRDVVERNLRHRVRDDRLRAMQQPRALRAIDGAIRRVEQLRSARRP